MILWCRKLQQERVRAELWLRLIYEDLISEAGAAAVFRLPTDFQKVSQTIRQYLRQ